MKVNYFNKYLMRFCKLKMIVAMLALSELTYVKSCQFLTLQIEKSNIV